MKPSDRYPCIDRRVLVSALAMLPVLSTVFTSVPAAAQTAASSGALPSWNEGPARLSILDFVRAASAVFYDSASAQSPPGAPASASLSFSVVVGRWARTADPT